MGDVVGLPRLEVPVGAAAESRAGAMGDWLGREVLRGTMCGTLVPGPELARAGRVGRDCLEGGHCGCRQPTD